ncbi:serine hydrolase [uncultured Sphingorhabdus sp.]|uniref:serine hydrolase domain-containing protein n=1 Tax=uncultured Sphingorhabdus sp. TaxID=1686106 RepID=UPI00260E334D|nr:serine hydrolase domain-containing protein [uncultured Sphingorhabdus sp.]
MLTLEAAFEASGLAGAVALIADRDGVRFVEAYGHADATTGQPMEVDTIFQIASMTKAIVSAGAMQLVESGALDLDAPIGDLLPQLANPQVLTGFSDSGEPQLRPASRPITLRHLLTHTAGLGYFFIRPEVLRYFAATGMPAPGSLASIQMPLLFDPGENWEYSVATDWVGLAVEAASGKRLGEYLQTNLLGPLGMSSTAFLDALPDDAAKVHARTPEGDLVIQPMFLGGGEFEMGGGGLSSTAHDYGRFVRMMLRGGELDGNRVLAEATVAEMARNQVAPLRAGFMGSAMPDLAQPYDTFPDQHTGWGLGFLINPEQGPNGRSPNSLAWAGIFNSYYWIDPAKGIGGGVVSQLAPFGDAGGLGFFWGLGRTAYGVEA